MTERLRWVIIWSVLAVWILNFAAGLLSALLPVLNYEPQEGINGVFTSVVTVLWASSEWVKARRGKGGDRDG